ncbi:FIST N-terminal domain-containing protein [Sedimentitalea sp. JM2-8]|uniref:FIST N-terminal domain-containing protein n=1 Tax=Sedimentitalea xiamensis TaxID=3050037 RepID=A0ABT7FAB5_9RHOB|nr:FIST N-terminal domain-containing protein [Sedimentitalea xiamensis]MDK3072055.1 FIST N-terminal domain-containing protein [Sedimentitalea xiamensis]
MGRSDGLSGALSRMTGIVRSAYALHDAPDPVRDLADALDPSDLEVVFLFVTPQADAAAIAARAKRLFAPATVVGCTTAGEISGRGYAEGEILAVGLPRSHFIARTLVVEDLGSYVAQDLIDTMIHNRNDMARGKPDWNFEFTFLMIDGMSVKEDVFMSDLSIGLGPVPLFGGSAGDGTDFGNTFILNDGRTHLNAAVLTQIRTRCPIKVFKTDHLVPTDQRMVVTGADPARRIVYEINAEPAALEYARLLGKDPQQLTAFTFAAHPVVVKIDGQHHVRAIQQLTADGNLNFFSAIDVGLVLTLAEPEDMEIHLEREIAKLSEQREPDTIIACDCLLRRLEAQEKQKIGALSDILARNRVVGFSTYGEQLNSMHVNQTLTGVAIYPPEDG